MFWIYAGVTWAAICASFVAGSLWGRAAEARIHAELTALSTVGAKEAADFKQAKHDL